MLCLKEWLELDRIRTEVYEPALNDTIAEMAARKTVRFLLESMEDEEDDGTPAELDDPFSGSEDAKPVKYEPEQHNEPESKIKIRLEDGKAITSERDAAKALKDAALWIRWSGMLERRRLIRQLQDMRKEDDPSYRPVTDNSDPSQPTKTKKSFRDIADSNFDIKDTIPILEKLGYIDEEKLKMDVEDDKKRDDMVRQAFYDATEETGNDMPPGITDEQIEKNAGKAKRDFFTILHEVFARQYSQLARSSRNTGMGGSGMKLYDAEELANKFALRMMDKISKRPTKGGSIRAWGGLRSDKKEFGRSANELEDDDFVDEILDHFKRLLYKEPAKAEDERRITLSPSRGTRDEFSNRDKKSSRINLDVKQALKDQAEGKTPESLSFYLDFLKAAKEGRENSYYPESMQEKDKFRFEIMSDIVAKASRNPAILSLEPAKIIATLQNYRTYFLKRSKSGPSFMSVMGSKDDGSSWDAPANNMTAASRQTDDERSYGRGARGDSDSGLSGRYSTPAASAMGGEERISLLERLRIALANLKRRNYKWAVAVCYKFGLGCEPDGTMRSPEKLLDGFSAAGIQRTSTGGIKGEKKSDCKNQLNAIGLSKQEVGQLIPLELGAEKQATVDSWIDHGLEFLCQELFRMYSADTAPSEEEAAPAINATPPKPLPKHAYVKPRFDSSKPSPLAGMMRRSQG
ncbi:hypothetical protein EBT16_01165 [bacterium]|nr:hypothetical protein [bacterium]